MGRLDLLTPWEPRFITAGILREHGLGPEHAMKNLAQAINDKWIRLAVTDLLDSAKKLSEKNPLLSVVDAEAILYAERENLAIFVADVEFRRECAKRKVPTAGLASILHSLVGQEILTKAQMNAIARKMEQAGYYAFVGDERKGLGL